MVNDESICLLVKLVLVSVICKELIYLEVFLFIVEKFYLIIEQPMRRNKILILWSSSYI